MIRILTPYSKTHYFIDKGVQRGVVYDAGDASSKTSVNKKLKTDRRDKITWCSSRRRATSCTSRSSRAAATSSRRRLTITPERAEAGRLHDAHRPASTEILVTGPGAPAVATVDDLAGKQVCVREQEHPRSRACRR